MKQKRKQKAARVPRNDRDYRYPFGLLNVLCLFGDGTRYAPPAKGKNR